MAKIIVIEGPDKVGKETQSRLLQTNLSNAGYRTLRVEVPSKACPRTHRLIYKMLGNGWAKRTPNFFQFVQFLNKFLFQHRVLPALDEFYDVIIFDRWRLSAIIYGNATGVNERLNRFLYRRLRKADITLVFHGRSFRRNSVDDAYEKDSELQARVKKDYVSWAYGHSQDHVLINNEGTLQEVQDAVQAELALREVL